MQETTNTKSGRGGAREGAGRKKLYARYYGFRATAEADTVLQNVTVSKSEYISRAIVAYHNSGDL